MIDLRFRIGSTLSKIKINRPDPYASQTYNPCPPIDKNSVKLLKLKYVASFPDQQLAFVPTLFFVLAKEFHFEALGTKLQ